MLGRGDIVGDRFEIRGKAGSGGVGVVYKGIDRTSGEEVAIKVLDGHADERNVARFLREGQVLAGIHHPRIVRYVGHGDTPGGQRYLVMEWLAGRDLECRLLDRPLDALESVRLARHIAEALGHAHAAGIIHRDIKPSNLFLVDDDVELVKLLDFGVARARGVSDMTVTGARVGTPAYMSPEQVRGIADLDARVDVFALGAVLYQCLTGRRPFNADDALALIGKILLADPEPLRDLRPDLPPELEALLARMLAKDPAERPPDGGAVAAALEGLLPAVAAGAPGEVGTEAGLTGKERRLLCLVLAREAALLAEAADLRALADTGRGRFEPLVDGSVVISLTSSGAATDLAAQAARIALAIRARLPGVPVAVATGRGLGVGEVIDRAARALRATVQLEQTISQEGAPPEREPSTFVRLDDVTAGLLDARFEVGGDAGGLYLRGERAELEVARTLLGRATPCVGRDAELASLVAIWQDTVAEKVARAVLVTAAAGVGKSRLRYELLQRLSTSDPPPEVLVARGDPMSAGAPFGLLGGMLRRAAGIDDGEPLAVRRRKLRARAGRHIAAADAQRVAEFLGEIAGTPFADESVKLRAARRDPVLMGDQMRRAWEEFVVAETAAGSLVLVVEDLHWGDAPTVAYLDAALRAARDGPLFVLALARPEVHQLFPELWAQREVQEIRLPELGRKASERLVRQVLGEVADEEVARVVERAGGNAFYLEESIRAAAEGRGSDLPETVLAMVQARLEAMEPEARQVLRAASVFGQVFWDGAVAELLGTSPAREFIRELTRREVFSRRPTSRYRPHAELVFRHALVREAAYAMLTEGDRALGHRLAGQWLERVGEPDAVVLAEHFERGGEPARAVIWYRRAAEQALGANDLRAALMRAERGLGHGASAEEAGELHLIAAEAQAWQADFPSALRAAEAAMAALPRGGESWYGAVAEAAFAAGVQGLSDRLQRLHDELAATRGAGDRGDRELLAVTRLAEQLYIVGKAALADDLLAGLNPVAGAIGEERPGSAGRILNALHAQARYRGDAGSARELAAQAAACFERAGDARNACLLAGRAGYALLEIGDFAAAERVLRETRVAAEAKGLSNIAAAARHNLGLTLARLGRYDEARREETAAAAEFSTSGNRRMEGASLEYLALIELAAGDASAAEVAARAAVRVGSSDPPLPLNQCEALAILAQALLAEGRAREAREAAARSMEIFAELGGIDDGEAIIRLTWADALHATGDATAARAAIAAARQRLLERAAKIADARLRRTFLEQVPENARTLALADEWR